MLEFKWRCTLASDGVGIPWVKQMYTLYLSTWLESVLYELPGGKHVLQELMYCLGNRDLDRHLGFKRFFVLKLPPPPHNYEG